MTSRSSSGSSSSSSSSSSTSTGGNDGVAWVSEPLTQWLHDVGDTADVRTLKPLRLLLPCAGWDAPSQALRALRVPHQVVGAWDTSYSAAQVLKRLHTGATAQHLHLGKSGDVLDVQMRNLPDAECLVSGPPCPPFSKMGRGKAWEDPRATVMLRIIKWIHYLSQKSLVCFVLENVEGILTKRGGGKSPCQRIVSRLQHGLKGKWHIEVLRCNSLCTGQSRPRVYIVGFKHTKSQMLCKSAVHDTMPLLRQASAASIILPCLPNTDLTRLTAKQQHNVRHYIRIVRELPSKKPFAFCPIDRDPDKPFGSQIRIDGFCPCLRASSGSERFFIVALGQRRPAVRRLLHAAEACLLQGMSPSIVPPGMSRRAVFKGCGNAMTVPVIGVVLLTLIRCALPYLTSSSRSSSSSTSSGYSDSTSSDGSESHSGGSSSDS